MGNGSYWDGSTWSNVQVDSPFDKAKVFVLSEAPAEPTPMRTGDLFIDTDTAKLSFRNGATWTPLSELATIADISGLQDVIDTINTDVGERALLSHTHASSDVVSGVLDIARVPDMSADKIISGTFAAARLPAATDSAIGGIEIATVAEVITGTDTSRAVTPNGLTARLIAYPDEVVPVGTIQIFAGTAVPSGWLICDGSSFDAAAYPRLYTAIGVTYGGTSTNPLLPNLKGRVVVGRDSSQTEFDTLGETGGEKAHALTADENGTHTHIQDSHNHTQNAHNHTQDAHNHSDPGHTHGPGTLNGWYRSRTDDDSGTGKKGAIEYVYSAFNTSYSSSNAGSVVINAGATDASGANLSAATATNQATTATNNATTATNQNSGLGTAHNNLQPYISLNYIIRAV